MKPKIVINAEVYEKIMYWVNKSSNEVSGLGMIKLESDGVVRVTSAMLLPQANTQTHTEIDADGVNKAMYALRHEDGELKFWWHSHVNMNVFWSGTDMATIREFGEGGYIVATVFNKRREMRSAYFDKAGIITPWGISELVLDELETTIQTQSYDTEAWDAEYTKNIKVYIPTSTYNQYDNFDNWRERDSATGRFRPRAHHASVTPMNSTDADTQQRLEDLRASSGSSQSILGSSRSAYDDYGFDCAERAMLATHGLTDADLDFLHMADFTPIEILALFEADTEMEEIVQLVNSGKEPAQIMRIFCAGEQLDFSDITSVTYPKGDYQ